MSPKSKFYFGALVFLGFAGLLVFLVKIANASIQVAAGAEESKSTIQALGLPGRSMNLISFSAVVADGDTVGSLAVYDDPRTARPEDYIELYDKDGLLVAVGWIDRFGIERIAVDRALLENRDDLHGTFVTVVDGEPI
jgi:hypothetical protein